MVTHPCELFLFNILLNQHSPLRVKYRVKYFLKSQLPISCKIRFNVIFERYVRKLKVTSENGYIKFENRNAPYKNYLAPLYPLAFYTTQIVAVSRIKTFRNQLSKQRQRDKDKKGINLTQKYQISGSFFSHPRCAGFQVEGDEKEQVKYQVMLEKQD